MSCNMSDKYKYELVGERVSVLYHATSRHGCYIDTVLEGWHARSALGHGPELHELNSELNPFYSTLNSYPRRRGGERV